MSIEKQREKNRRQKEAVQAWLASKRKYKQAKRRVNRTKEEQKYCSGCRCYYKDCFFYQVMEGKRFSPRKGIQNHFAKVVGMIEHARLYSEIRTAQAKLLWIIYGGVR